VAVRTYFSFSICYSIKGVSKCTKCRQFKRFQILFLASQASDVVRSCILWLITTAVVRADLSQFFRSGQAILDRFGLWLDSPFAHLPIQNICQVISMSTARVCPSVAPMHRILRSIQYCPANLLAAGVSMYRVLPSDVSLEDIKREATNLLYRLRQRDETGLRRYYSFDPFAGMFEPRIDEAQYVIAREYGYASWRRLMEHLGALPARKIRRAIAASAR